jgi:DNA-directed RNA polymerase specialized sigma24 family protein
VRTDAELIASSLAGDDEAFVEVIRRHQQAVWGYLVRRIGRGLAEDLLSEVWLRALRSRGGYDRSFPEARPWLFGIARNVLRRGGAPQLAVSTTDANEPGPGWDPWPAIDSRIDGATVLRCALRDLTEEQRDVLLLVVWEELTITEAARSLGIPAGTARYRLHRARLALRSSPGMVALLTDFNMAREESR